MHHDRGGAGLPHHKRGLLIGQSGGPTAVINASLAGVLDEASRHPEVTHVLGMVNGVEGWLSEELLDLSGTTPEELAALAVTPAAALGSCRRKITAADFERLLAVLDRYGVRYLLYAGGNDSMDTCHKVWQAARQAGYALRVVGIPKTIDNDLAFTDHCPGYGSAARFIALSVRDAGLDQQALKSFVPILITEVMGRDTGWLAAAAALARTTDDDAPHLVYVPEQPFDEAAFLAAVERVYRRHGWASVVACEGLTDPAGELLGASDAPTDPFGHKALPLGSGVGQYLARLVHRETGLLVRVNRPGTVQRSLSCAVSEVDRSEAALVGAAAVRRVLSGEDGCMITLEREPHLPYRCVTGAVPLATVANVKRFLPEEMIPSEGKPMREAFRDYALPLVGDPFPVAWRPGWPRAKPIA